MEFVISELKSRQTEFEILVVQSVQESQHGNREFHQWKESQQYHMFH